MRTTLAAALRYSAFTVMVLAGATVIEVPTATAVSLPQRVTVWGPLSSQVIASTTRAASDAGGRATVVRQGTVDLVGLRRGGSVVSTAAAGMVYPVSLSSVDAAPVDTLLGQDVGRALRQGGAVLSQSSARVRRAKVGDEIDVVGWNAKRLRLRVGAVVPDARALSSELLVSHDVATKLGVGRNSQVLVWGATRARMESALRKRLPKGQSLSRSWGPSESDGVLSQAQIKAQLGEFAIRVSGSTIKQDQAWLNQNIVRESVPIIGPVWCHRAVMPALRKALAEVQRRGLAKLIDVADTRRNGGCYGGAREIRGSSARNLSRHSWGAAVDINPATNPFGGRVRMDKRIVEIFRRQGFVWGGTWDIPDGMHFEYVGRASK